MSRLQFSIEAKNDQWEIIHEKLLGFSRLHHISKQDEYNLTLICEEWFYNIVHHGFPASHHKEANQSIINIGLAAIGSNKVEILFEDEGIPFNPFNNICDDVKLASIDQDLGGLGLYFIIKLLDKYDYSYRNSRNRVKMYYVAKRKETSDEYSN